MTLAIIIFVVAYALIASEKFPRHAVALLGGVIMSILGIFGTETPLKEAMTFVDWETMGLLLGMFILVGILAEIGFFNWLAIEVAHRLRYRPAAIFIGFPLLAALMAAFMDSITVMLFLSALTVRISKLISIDPVPLIISEVCCANTGGASTLVGDPPNVILGNMLGFTFNDFVIHSGPLAILSAILIALLLYRANRTMLHKATQQLDFTMLADIRGANAVTDQKTLRLALIGFASAIALLVTHHDLSHWLHVEIGAAAAALIPALAVMMLGNRSVQEIIKKLDIESLLFFIGLFIMVGALERTHLIDWLARQLVSLTSGNNVLLILLLHWAPGLASGVIDNIPMALAMGYVLRDIATLAGAPALGIMTWALALGVDIGGNLTPVGASPNLVSYVFMERNHYHIGWARWIKTAAPPTLLAMLVCSVLLIIKYAIGFY